MPITSPIPKRRKRNKHRNRGRGSCVIGKIWLLLIFFLLSIMNYTASMITPFIGSFAPLYLSALITATFWSGILLAAIWFGQGWGRAVLAIFLVSFVLAQISFLPDALVYYPALRGIGTEILILLSCSNFFSAVFLLISKDIQCLSRPVTD